MAYYLTGLWEVLEGSISKPECVRNCEAIESEIVETHKTLLDLHHKRVKAYHLAVQTMEQYWTQEEISSARNNAIGEHFFKQVPWLPL